MWKCEVSKDTRGIFSLHGYRTRSWTRWWGEYRLRSASSTNPNSSARVERPAASCVLHLLKSCRRRGHDPQHTLPQTPPKQTLRNRNLHPSWTETLSSSDVMRMKCFSHTHTLTQVESMNTTKTVHLKTFTSGGKLKGLRSWPTSWLTCSWGTLSQSIVFPDIFQRHCYSSWPFWGRWSYE